MLKDVLDRVEGRLDALGLRAAEASRLAGLSSDAIRNLRRAVERPESRQGVSTRTLSALAPVLKTSVSWLMDGHGAEDQGDATAPDVRMVRVVGYVGAGDAAHFYDTAQGPFDEVPAPQNATKDTVAAEIRGPSIGRNFDGWLVFYDEIRHPVTEDLHGELCVVGLPDGRVLVKWLKAAKSPGLYHLISETEGPMNDQEVSWAAKVTNMRPR